VSGNSFLLDTNIVLHILNGDKTIASFLNHSSVFISFITEIELLSYHGFNLGDLQKVKKLIEELQIIDLSSEIKEIAIGLRIKHRLKIPDALIAATAIAQNLPLVSADIGFKKVEQLELVFYKA